MDGLLGDVSIESAIPVNTDDLYLFHPKSRQAVSNFLLLANNQGSSFPILESPLSQLLEDGELIKQVREYYFEKHRTLHAVVHGPKLKAEWFIFNDQLWLVRLKSNIDGTENVDLKNIFDEEDHFYSGYSMLKASWFSGKLHYQIGSLEREPSTNKLGYQAVVFDIDNGDVLSRQIKTVVSMSNKNKPIKIELPL